MKSKKSLLLLALISIIIFDGQSVFSQKKQSKPQTTNNSTEIVATVGKEKITFSELEKAYKKNMNRRDVNLKKISKDSLMDFLNLYTNYRLKVLDAINRNMDKDSSVLADITQNKKVLAESFLFEKTLTEPFVQTMLERRKEELKIGVILLQFPGAGNVDTTLTYNRAMKILSLLKSGTAFEQIARDSSDDKESAKNNGIIPSYITSGKVQRPIEDAIFSLSVGDVYAQPIKTKYGYFIVKLFERIPRVNAKFSHILLSTEGNDTNNLDKKADSLLALLHKGMSFEKLARENSSDPSASKGGAIDVYYSRSFGFLSSGQHIVPEMEKVVFSLKPGHISEKVHTDYGVHIVRLDSIKPFSYEEEREDVKKIYKRIYYENDKSAFIDSLRTKYNFVYNKDVLKQFLALVDTTKTSLDSNWLNNINDDLSKKTLFSLLNKNTPLSEITELISKKSEYRGTPLNYAGITRIVQNLTEPVVVNEAIKNIEKDYPEFNETFREFRDGILLFRVEALEVWDKLKFDSVLARKYWESNKSKYNTEEKYDISEIYVPNDSVAKEVYTKLQSGINFDSLANQYTQRAGYREKHGRWGLVTLKNNKLAQIAKEKNLKVNNYLAPQVYEQGFSIIKLNNFEPIRMKTFEEAISDFAAEFQDMVQKNLTDIWLNKVKTNYPVKIFKENLEKCLKN